MKKTLDKKNIYLLLPLLCVLISFTPLKILAFLALICFVALILPLNKYGLITRLIISFFLIFSVNTLVAALAWMLKLSLDAGVLTAIYSLMLFFIVLFYNARPTKIRFDIKKPEIVAAVFSTFLLLIIMAPVIQNNTLTNLLRISPYGGDNLSHLQLVNAVAQKQGYTHKKYKANIYNISVIKPLYGYPQGYHFNIFFINDLIKNLHGQIINARWLLLTYYSITALWFAILAYLFLLLVFSVIDNIKSPTLIEYIVALSVGAWLFLGLFFTLFAYGFQTQVAALSVLLAILLILFEAVRANSHKLGLIVVASILTTSTSFIWLFIWPVAVTALTIFLLINIKSYFRLIPLIVLVSSVALVQVWVQVAITVKKGGLNEQGLITPVSVFVLVGLLSLSSLYVLVRNKVTEVKIVTLFGATATVFSISVMIYQLISVGELRYYFFKATHTFILLAAVLIAALAAQALAWFVNSNKLSRNTVFLTSALLMAAGGCLAWSQHSAQANDYLKRKPYGISLEMADAVDTLYGSSHSLQNTIAIGSCNRVQDIKAINLITAISGIASPADSVASAEFYSPKKSDTFKAVKDYQKLTKEITVISSDYSIEQDMQSYLGQAGKNIKYVELGGPYQSSGSASSCPERLR